MDWVCAEMRKSDHFLEGALRRHLAMRRVSLNRQ
jgi:hypothetical protein